MQTIIALAFVAALCSAASFSKQETAYKFDMFKKQFNKVYADSAEESARMAVFSSNLDFIEKQNELFRTGKSGFTVGVNEFADLTSEEFAKLYLSTFNTTRERNVVYLPEEAVEASVDWRTKGAVTPVKNQGQCGSCWSFSTTGSTEGAHAIASGNLVSLSEQQLMDCSTSFGNQGCNGGLMDNAFKYIVQNGGLDTEEDYPYTAQDGSCNKEKEAKHAVSIKGYKDVPQDNEAQLKAAVTKGPVSVAIEADQQAFQLYKSGVFDAACGTRLDHGVLVVGYGTEGGKDYWIVKNSWGASWGLQGYILMAQGKGAAGECGIAMQPSYPEAGSGPAPPSPPSPGPAPPPPSPPSPPSSHHYGAPPCLSDETAVQITGISGDFCSPKCSLFKPCTTDVPPGTTAKPQCVLEAQGHSSPTNCALVCTPGENNGGCPSGATCQPIQGTGICTYPAA